MLSRNKPERRVGIVLHTVSTAVPYRYRYRYDMQFSVCGVLGSTQVRRAKCINSINNSRVTVKPEAYSPMGPRICICICICICPRRAHRWPPLHHGAEPPGRSVMRLARRGITPSAARLSDRPAAGDCHPGVRFHRSRPRSFGRNLSPGQTLRHWCQLTLGRFRHLRH